MYMMNNTLVSDLLIANKVLIYQDTDMRSKFDYSFTALQLSELVQKVCKSYVSKTIIGATVSVDMSTNDKNAYDRIFAKVIGIQYSDVGLTLISEYESNNYN